MAKLGTFSILSPDLIECTVLGANPLSALRKFHGEALGDRAVRIVNGELRFRRAEHQAMCSGVWTVVPTDGGPEMRIEVPPPSES